jgi:sulfofructose kinase
MISDTSPDIIGIGICTVDHLLSVSQMPKYGLSIKASQYLQQSGGLVASALVAATRLGTTTKIIARIGDDDEGQYIQQDLDREGVDASKLLVEANTHTHISMILVDDNTGERSFISRWATGSTITLNEISREEITSAKILFVDDVTETTLQAAQWAREAGVTVVIDPSCPFDIVKDLLPWVDVPIVPESFATQWMPNDPAETVVKALYDLGARIAIVTLGERGCVVCSADGVQAYPTIPVDVVDTTGAGDAFHGAFMYALLQDWDVPRMTRFAVAVGAMNCRFLGGRTGLPTRQDVDDFLDEFGI